MQLTISTVSILRVRSDVAANASISFSRSSAFARIHSACPSSRTWRRRPADRRAATRALPSSTQTLKCRRRGSGAPRAPSRRFAPLRLHAVKGLRAPPRAGDAAGRVPTRLAQLGEAGLLDVGDADHLEPRDLRGVAQLAEVEVEERRRALLGVDEPTDGDGAQLGELVAHREVGDRRVLLDRLRQRDEACGVVAGGRRR